MEKKPFVTREQLEEIKKTYPTPFHLYDEKGIRENGERLMRAFSWNKGFREYFAVKATPNPFVIDILKKLGCGVDCSSLTELMMAKAMKYDGEKIMFSSNDTPPEEFKMAAELGAIINLDDFTHIDFLEDDRLYSRDDQLPLQSGRTVQDQQRYHGQPRRCEIRYDNRAVI